MDSISDCDVSLKKMFSNFFPYLAIRPKAEWHDRLYCFEHVHKKYKRGLANGKIGISELLRKNRVSRCARLYRCYSHCVRNHGYLNCCGGRTDHRIEITSWSTIFNSLAKRTGKLKRSGFRNVLFKFSVGIANHVKLSFERSYLNKKYVLITNDRSP